MHVYNYQAVALDRLAWIFHHMLSPNGTENTQKNGRAGFERTGGVPPNPFTITHEHHSGDGCLSKDNGAHHKPRVIPNLFTVCGNELTVLRWPPQPQGLSPVGLLCGVAD